MVSFSSLFSCLTCHFGSLSPFSWPHLWPMLFRVKRLENPVLSTSFRQLFLFSYRSNCSCSSSPIGDLIIRGQEGWRELLHSMPVKWQHDLVSKKNMTSCIWGYYEFYPGGKGELNDITHPTCKLYKRCVQLKDVQILNNHLECDSASDGGLK